MITFLEYFKGDPILNPKMRNGKDIFKNPLDRKHSNVFRKEYKHKHHVVHNIATGKSNNIFMRGMPLDALLTTYNTEFTPGVKTLGNSKVEVEMYEDEEGVHCGILRRRTNGV